jgi:hypothetical protein
MTPSAWAAAVSGTWHRQGSNVTTQPRCGLEVRRQSLHDHADHLAARLAEFNAAGRPVQFSRRTQRP